VDFGAALPFHAEYFYLGALTYFFYKRTLLVPLSRTPAVVSLVIALFVFQLGHRHHALIPICLWFLVLGVLCERGDSHWISVATKPLLHPIAQFAGKISYSLYLCHMLVLYVAQHVILLTAPDLSRTAHCFVLVVVTLAIAIPASALLFRYVEEPAMRLGRRLGARAQQQDAVLEPAPSRNSEVRVAASTNNIQENLR
jgi:peptidoglycan/LPS O-acetylase OafA/YrhL